MNFFLKHNCIIKFSCMSWPLAHSAKFLKKFLELVQSYEDVLFSGPKWPICHEQFFLVQTIIVTFICAYWPFSLYKILKNSYGGSRVMRMCHFRAQNTPICPEQNFLVQTIIITFIYFNKNHNIFQRTHFNHTMTFFKLID